MQIQTVKFKIHKETYTEVLRYLQEGLQLYQLNWKDAFQSIYSDAFRQCKQPLGENWEENVEKMKEFFGLIPSNSYHHIHEEELMELNREWMTVEKQEEGDIVSFEMSFGHSKKWVFFADTLDLLFRIRMGQWDDLERMLMEMKNQEGKSVGNCCFLGSKEIDFWRKLIVPYYQKEGITGSASFGICSIMLDKKIRLVYDFYKFLQYENGVGGCYAFRPYVTAGDMYKAPSISFPYKHTSSLR